MTEPFPPDHPLLKRPRLSDKARARLNSPDAPRAAHPDSCRYVYADGTYCNRDAKWHDSPGFHHFIQREGPTIARQNPWAPASQENAT